MQTTQPGPSNTISQPSASVGQPVPQQNLSIEDSPQCVSVHSLPKMGVPMVVACLIVHDVEVCAPVLYKNHTVTIISAIMCTILFHSAFQ